MGGGEGVTCCRGLNSDHRKCHDVEFRWLSSCRLLLQAHASSSDVECNTCMLPSTGTQSGALSDVDNWGTLAKGVIGCWLDSCNPNLSTDPLSRLLFISVHHWQDPKQITEMSGQQAFFNISKCKLLCYLIVDCRDFIE